MRLRAQRLATAANPARNNFYGSTLNLNFLNTTRLDPRITFGRTAPATYFDSTGVLQTMGLNLLIQSSTFTNSAWAKTDITATLDESSPLDLGYLITEGNAGNARLLQQSTVAAGATITNSVALKRGNTDWIRVSASASGDIDGVDVWVNLSSGTFTATAKGAATNAGGTVTNLGGGWYRVTATCTPNGTYTTANFIVSSASASGSFTRINNSTYMVSAAQLERSTIANTYSATTTTANSGPRFDYNPATPAGVVGPQLVTNGDFSQGTTGWSQIGTGGAIAVVNGELEITATSGNFPGVRRLVTTETGKRYLVTATVRRGTTTAIVGLNVIGLWPGQTTQTSNTTNTQLSVYFTAQSTSTNIDLVINSGTANGTAYFDNISVQEVTFNPRGLLIEEARTNLLLQSRDMTQAAWSKNDVTATRNQVGLDGVANTACLMTEGSAGSAATTQLGAAVTAGSTMTQSIVAKRGNTDWVRFRISAGADGCDAWFNLATGVKGAASAFGVATSTSSVITNLGGGWYRLSVTCVPNGSFTQAQIQINSATADASGTRVPNATYIVDCAQLEVGSFATSIIPTTTATVTRAADSAVMTGTNFSSWFNASAGTFAVDFSRPSISPTALSYNQSLLCASSASGGLTDGFNILCGASNPSQQRFDVYAASVSQASIVIGTGVSGVVYKIAAAYASNDFSAASNGSLGTPDNSGSLPTVDRLAIGSNVGTAQGASYIRRIAYYPSRLDNATLQKLTR